jgi:hypothetical protein
VTIGAGATRFGEVKDRSAVVPGVVLAVVTGLQGCRVGGVGVRWLEVADGCGAAIDPGLAGRIGVVLTSGLGAGSDAW